MSDEMRKNVKAARWDNPISMCCDKETRDVQTREMTPNGSQRCSNPAIAVIVENEAAIAFRCEYHRQADGYDWN